MYKPKLWEVNWSKVVSLVTKGKIDTVLTIIRHEMDVMGNYVYSMYNLIGDYRATRNEIFDYLDSLSDRGKIHVLMESRSLENTGGSDFLSDYFTPRLVDGRIKKESLRCIVISLLVGGLCPSRRGRISFIVGLTTNNILTRAELGDILAEVRSSVSLDMCGNRSTLILERYVPEDAALELPRKHKSDGEIYVEVPRVYLYAMINADVCKLVLEVVLDTPDDAYEIMTKIALMIAPGTRGIGGALPIVYLCLLLVSKKRAEDLARDVIRRHGVPELCFNHGYVHWYLSDDIVALENIIISHSGKPLLEYDEGLFAPDSNQLKRLDHLIATREDNV